MTVTSCPRNRSTAPRPTNGWTSPALPSGTSRTFTRVGPSDRHRLAQLPPDRDELSAMHQSVLSYEIEHISHRADELLHALVGRGGGQLLVGEAVEDLQRRLP